MSITDDVNCRIDQLVDLDPDINHFSVLYPNLNIISHCSQYYDIDKFNSSFPKSINDISTVHLKIRSLYHKLDYSNVLLNHLNFKFDIFALLKVG